MPSFHRSLRLYQLHFHPIYHVSSSVRTQAWKDSTFSQAWLWNHDRRRTFGTKTSSTVEGKDKKKPAEGNDDKELRNDGEKILGAKVEAQEEVAGHDFSNNRAVVATRDEKANGESDWEWETNPYFHMLSSPLRRCVVTKKIMPNALMVRFILALKPESASPTPSSPSSSSSSTETSSPKLSANPSPIVPHNHPVWKVQDDPDRLLGLDNHNKSQNRMKLHLIPDKLHHPRFSSPSSPTSPPSTSASTSTGHDNSPSSPPNSFNRRSNPQPSKGQGGWIICSRRTIRLLSDQRGVMESVKGWMSRDVNILGEAGVQMDVKLGGDAEEETTKRNNQGKGKGNSDGKGKSKEKEKEEDNVPDEKKPFESAIKKGLVERIQNGLVMRVGEEVIMLERRWMPLRSKFLSTISTKKSSSSSSSLPSSKNRENSESEKTAAVVKSLDKDELKKIWKEETLEVNNGGRHGKPAAIIIVRDEKEPSSDKNQPTNKHETDWRFPRKLWDRSRFPPSSETPAAVAAASAPLFEEQDHPFSIILPLFSPTPSASSSSPLPSPNIPIYHLPTLLQSTIFPPLPSFGLPTSGKEFQEEIGKVLTGLDYNASGKRRKPKKIKLEDTRQLQAFLIYQHSLTVDLLTSLWRCRLWTDEGWLNGLELGDPLNDYQSHPSSQTPEVNTGAKDEDVHEKEKGEQREEGRVGEVDSVMKGGWGIGEWMTEGRRKRR